MPKATKKETAAPPTLIKVDKGVPIPPVRGNINWGILPFNTIEIGESFLAPVALFNIANGKQATPQNIQIRISSRLILYRPKKFVTRVEREGVRIWRIE